MERKFSVMMDCVSGRRRNAVVDFDSLGLAIQFCKNWMENARDVAEVMETEGERLNYFPLGCTVWTRNDHLAAVVGFDYVDVTLED